ncbi:MAG: hypothetical protein GY716_07685 [bacterium]|nr:hypothetical protein [bacterium]
MKTDDKNRTPTTSRPNRETRTWASDSRAVADVDRSDPVPTPLSDTELEYEEPELSLQEILALDKIRWVYELSIVPGPDMIQ